MRGAEVCPWYGGACLVLALISADDCRRSLRTMKKRDGSEAGFTKAKRTLQLASSGSMRLALST